MKPQEAELCTMAHRLQLRHQDPHEFFHLKTEDTLQLKIFFFLL